MIALLKSYKSIFLFSILFLVLVSCSFLFTYKWLDPDFGWHLRTGQLILERGVPKVDWYSYTMPNFQWIDNEPLTDVLIYKVYLMFGFYPLLIIFLLLYTASFFIMKRSKQPFFDLLLPIFFGYWATISFLGIRPQLLTVLLIAILWKILDKFLNNNTRIIYILPVLFMLWVNLHAGFFAGIFIVFTTLVIEIFKKIKFIQRINFLEIKEQSYLKISKLGFILVLSFFATILNPYGLRIYGEVFGVVGDNFLKFNVTEWFPLIYAKSAFVPLYMSLFIFLWICTGIKFHKKVNLNEIIFCLLFLILSFFSQRYFLIFVIFTIPLLGDFFSYFRQEIKLKLGKESTWIIFLSATAIIIFSLCTISIVLVNTTDFYPLLFPNKAIPFLKTLPLSENMFNEYDWGGYLIWKLPERKVFIDGRMPSWREGNQFVFGDYMKMMQGHSDTNKLLEKYNIQIVLLKKEEKNKAIDYLHYQDNPRTKTSELQEKYQWLLKQVLKIRPPSKNIYNVLIDSNWHIIYEDDVAIVLKK